MLFCNPWSLSSSSPKQQQQDRELLLFDQEHLPSTEAAEPSSEFTREIATADFETPVKETSTDNNHTNHHNNPIIMLFFGQRNPQHNDDKEAADAAAATPATVGMEDEDEQVITPLSPSYAAAGDDDVPESALQPQQPQAATPMIRMKNFFATPFVPPNEDSTLPPSAKETGDSIDTTQNIETSESSEDSWLPLDKTTSLTQSISRALNFDALLSARSSGEAVEAVPVDKDVIELDDLSTTTSSASSPMKYLVMAVVFTLLAMSANNTYYSVQERRAVFRSAHAHAQVMDNDFEVEQPSKPAPDAPETSPQDAVDSRSSATKEEALKTAPTQETPAISSSFDFSSLLFWKRSPQEPKAQFFPWVDEALVKAQAWTLCTLQQTHVRLLNFADFLQAHKEERAFQRLCYRDAMQEQRRQANGKWWSQW